MPEQSISLRSVYELRVDVSDQPIRYRIPAYQRGFRWASRQVEQLLNTRPRKTLGYRTPLEMLRDLSWP